MAEAPRYLRIGRTDNVAVALTDLAAGEHCCVDGLEVTLSGAVGRGHKFALKAIPAGTAVIKYDMPIGEATRDIAPGEFVHTHNLKTRLAGELEYTYNPVPPAPLPATEAGRTFLGFRRADGTVGVRNDLWIIPTVGCVNKLAENLARDFERQLPQRSVRRVLAFPHPYGCSQLGDDHETTANMLAALAKHPNAGGVLIVALGCENNTLESFQKRLGDCDRSRIRFLKAQEDGSEYDEGLKLLAELAEQAAKLEREPVPVSELKVGLKCGGSDGLSGITANPLIGRFSDLLTAAGGTSVLTEVPEMFGAEQRLMNRCRDRETYARYCRLITDFRDYYTAQGFPVYENPSPGNRAGGITTLEEKSLGCIEKAGHTAICDVLPYAGRVKESGVSVLNAPGNDLIAATALAAAGCQLVLFTTGRGTPFSTFVPTLKIATNSALAQKKSGWIDFNAEPMDADALWSLILRTANGDYRAKSEDLREIAFFKTGVTL